ncbi:MAG TPA: DMT family transporter [Flavobacteriaceae bacterium]|nr:DMT family transporter [Flavobacteriaceae bacterium]
MSQQQLKWIYLVVLSLVWGSSFILIKKGLLGLTAMQLGALRILLAALFLFLIGFKSLKNIEKKHWKWISVSAFLGTFFPAFLFAYAQTEIDSAIAAILNSTTPLLTFVLGLSFFGVLFAKRQFLGVMIGLAGTVLLIFSGASVNPGQNYWFALLPLLASLMYAFNANIIKYHLHEISAMGIAVSTFVVLFPPTFAILIFSGFFDSKVLGDEQTWHSFMYVAILAVAGTGLAKVMFNKLIHMSTAVFASSVTYLIPVVAFMWGFLDGETFGILQLLAAMVILVGVYLANRK